VFGLLMYVYNPIVTWLNEQYPTSGDYATVMFFFWGIIAAVFLFASGIRLVMQMQKKTGY